MTDEEGSGPFQPETCRLCGRAVVLLDGQSISVSVNRSAVAYDIGPEFRESQSFAFCELAHANEFLAKHPIPDTWDDSEFLDGESGALGTIGCVLGVLVLIAVVATGAVVVAQAAWDLVA